MNHPADVHYFRQLDRIEREQLADESAHSEIETALLAGESIRYGVLRYQVLDADDVKGEFSSDVFGAVAKAIAAGDAIEAARLFSAEHANAIGAIAERHAGLRACYLAASDAEECAADRHAEHMEAR